MCLRALFICLFRENMYGHNFCWCFCRCRLPAGGPGWSLETPAWRLELIEDEARVRILEQSADAESAKRARKIKTACSPVCTGALSPSLPDCLVATDRPEPQPVSQCPAVAKLIHAENLRHICFICAINK